MRKKSNIRTMLLIFTMSLLIAACGDDPPEPEADGQEAYESVFTSDENMQFTNEGAIHRKHWI